jgi:hypothetical protein
MTMSFVYRGWFRSLRHLLVLASVCATSVSAAAEPGKALPRRPPTILAAPTDLSSTAERMISYRHQEHMWQSSDGALHLVYNRGTLEPGPGLSLFSSFDGGGTWTFMFDFANTDDASTADGAMQDDRLSLVYPTVDGTIAFAELLYDSVTRSWTLTGAATAFSSSDWEGQNPALGFDSTGTIWCAFVARERTDRRRQTNIRMVNRVAGGFAWTDTGLVFGPTDAQSIERSARPVRTANGMGMVYSVRESMFWATRVNGMPDNVPWTVSTIYVSPNPTSPKADPYASHFSVVTDDSSNIHLVLSDNFEILYFRWSGAGPWSSAVAVDTGGQKAGYPQIGVANGKLALAFILHQGDGAVLLVSADQGTTFSTAAQLAHRGVTYGTARLETPTRTLGPLTVLQQYEQESGLQRLMLFTVPPP